MKTSVPLDSVRQKIQIPRSHQNLQELAWLLSGLMLGMAPFGLWAQGHPDTFMARLTGAGQGWREYHDPDGWWQRIDYQCEVNFVLDAEFLSRSGDTNTYQSTRKRGGLHFGGTAVDHFFGSTTTWDFDTTNSYDLQTRDGVIRYSGAQHRIIYAGFPLSTASSSEVLPYHLRFYGYSPNTNDHFVRAYVALPSFWWFDEMYDLPGACKRTAFMLTFDDGPKPGCTDKIVRTLSDFLVQGEPVRAAFFMVGTQTGCTWNRSRSKSG